MVRDRGLGCVVRWPEQVAGSANPVFQQKVCYSPAEVREIVERHEGVIVDIEDAKIGRHCVELGGNGKLPSQLSHLFRSYEASRSRGSRATRGAR